MNLNDIVLQTEGITKKFPGTIALDNVDFVLKKGSFHGLMGENGAGKSTFVKILCGVYQKDCGTIWLNGNDFEPKNILHSTKNGISIIHQEAAIVGDLTVSENIYLNNLTKYGRIKLNWKAINADAEKILNNYGIDINPKIVAGKLPIGQQKMVELIKAIATDPQILILDEVTANLDAEEEMLLFKIVKELINYKKLSVIYISHRMKELFAHCDYVTVFKDGKVVNNKNVIDTNIDEITSSMVGREIKEKGYYRQYFNEIEKHKKPVLEVKKLTKNGEYEDVSIELYPGEILGIGGLSDAGQQSIVHTIYGDMYQDSGQIILNGKEVIVKSPSDAIRKGIGFLPRDRDREGLILIHSISNNICLPILNKITSKLGTIKYKHKKNISSEYYKKLNIKSPSINTQCVSLSGGNRQKVVFAKLIASNVNILILNHPTIGVDVGAKQEFYALMQEFIKKGLSIIMVSDELPELIGMSDRIVIMRNGKIAKITDYGEKVSEEQLIRFMIK